jgi:hypothetical protein
MQIQEQRREHVKSKTKTWDQKHHIPQQISTRGMEIQWVEDDWQQPQTDLGSAALLRILELSHEALVTGIITTKRFLKNNSHFLFRPSHLHLRVLPLVFQDQPSSRHLISTLADLSPEIYIIANQNCSSNRQSWTGM